MKTKTTLILLCIVSLLSLQTRAQELSLTQNNAVLSFVAEELNYGDIDQNSNGTRIFKFVNSGNAPLVITEVKTSCGCTVPSYSKEPILPGQLGQIEVAYNTKKVGAFKKTITVVSNAKEGHKILTIKGNVQAVN
ncbi:MAG: DUF1573 domain-containing protein [Winogradskyella sp.]|nr:DUF1573 domain-containing protein [Winogradskyella sp.]NNK39130.1 DUF1573 domain-containing protein [Winogradskyella sp.]